LVLPSFKTFGGEILHRCLIFGKKTCKKVSVGLDFANPAVALKEGARQMIPKMAETFQRLVADLEAMPRHQVEKSRHRLSQVLVSVRMIPQGAKGLVAEIEIHGAGLLRMATGGSGQTGSGGAIRDSPTIWRLSLAA
jgi:hypothetical protein